MAGRKKGARVKIGLVCSICNAHNYTTEKNRMNIQDKIELKKFCKRCRKHTVHKEKKKLH